jgi:hypothetical protein
MKTIHVMFMGERIRGWHKKIEQMFKAKDGKEFFFSGIKRPWFGTVYEMKLSANGSASLNVRPKEVEADWEPSEKERQEFEGAKLVVTAERQARQKAMKLQRPHDDIVRAVKLLRPFYRAMPDQDRRRFMEWVSNECSRKGKK